jgi:hypothetical protein
MRRRNHSTPFDIRCRPRAAGRSRDFSSARITPYRHSAHIVTVLLGITSHSGPRKQRQISCLQVDAIPTRAYKVAGHDRGQRIAYPPLRRATYCFSWTRKPRESDSVRFQCIPTGPSQVRPPDWLRTQRLWTMHFGADRCKWLRHFLVPRADFAWDNRVQVISSAAKAGIPDRLGHARGYASALSPSAVDP